MAAFALPRRVIWLDSGRQRALGLSVWRSESQLWFRLRGCLRQGRQCLCGWGVPRHRNGIRCRRSQRGPGVGCHWGAHASRSSSYQPADHSSKRAESIRSYKPQAAANHHPRRPLPAAGRAWDTIRIARAQFGHVPRRPARRLRTQGPGPARWREWCAGTDGRCVLRQDSPSSSPSTGNTKGRGDEVARRG